MSDRPKEPAPVAGWPEKKIRFMGVVTFSDVFGDMLINPEEIPDTKIMGSTIRVSDDFSMCESQKCGIVC